MFESPDTMTPPAGAVAIGAARVESWVSELASAGGPADDGARLDLVTALEHLKNAAAGLQASLAVEVDTSMRERAAERGVPAARLGQGVAQEIALARCESPHRGQQHLGLGKVLASEMPFTRRALRRGRLSEWRATILARETACLSRADRVEVDRRVAGDVDALERLGDRELGDAVRRHAYALDAESWVARRRIAESERRVTLRPALDVMSRLSAELPVVQGVAVIHTLGEHADSLRAAGDARSRSQIMADTLVERLLGTEHATVLPVRAHVVVADDVLFGTAEEPAHLDGFGPIPAELARELVRGAGREGLAELQRLYVTPETGELVAADSRARFFPEGLGRFIELRDQICRTPWCDAPIRHRDHAVPVAEGGETSRDNGQGLCAACNYAKEAIGWRARPSPGDRHSVEITTPAGRTYRSTAPAQPRLRVDYRYPVTLVA
jgi:hypothetical protein